MRAYNKDPAKRAQRTEYARRHRVKHPERYLHANLKAKHGISLDEYTRLFHEQGGCCAICGSRDGHNKNGGVRLHVDHDHVTGKPRGLLCGTCNRGIGQLGDDLNRVQAAARYLQRFQTSADAPVLDPRIVDITRRVLGRDVTITREMLMDAERIRCALAAQPVM